MEYKKGIVMMLIVILAFGMSGCVFKQNTSVSSNNDGKQNKVLKIGVIAPLTGDYAQMGISNLRSAKLAAKDFGNIEIIAEDDELDTKLAVNAYQKLKNVDDIDALIVMTTPSIEALKPLIEQDKMPTIVVGQDLNVKDDYVFHIAESIFAPYIELGKEMRNYENPVFLIGESSWRDEVVANYELGYGDDANIIYFNNDDSASTTILKLEEGNYTAFSIDSIVSAWVPLYNRIDDLNLDDEIVHVLNYNEEANFRAGSFKDKVPDSFFEGKRLVSIESGSVSNEEFMQRYKEEYGEDVTFFGDFGYDAVSLFVKVEPTDSNWQTKAKSYSFTGVTGNIVFDENGDRIPKTIRGYIQNGDLVLG